MKFQAKKGHTHCKNCKQPYKPETFRFEGVQDCGGLVKDFPLFTCSCGSTIAGVLIEEKTKVLKEESDK